MNIGMVVDNELDGDVRVNNEAQSLAKNGFGVFILCLGKPGQVSEKKRNQYTIVRLSIGKNWRNKTFFFANTIPVFHMQWKRFLIRFIKNYNIDILHAHDLYMAKSAYQAAKSTGIRWVLDLHENFPAAVYGYRWALKFPNRIFTRPQAWKKFEKKYLHKADSLIVLSEYFKKDLLKKHSDLDASKIYIYSNVPDTDKLMQYPINKDILPVKQNSKILFYFGGIAKRRGIFTLIEAHKRLLHKGRDVKLLLIGPVDKAERDNFDKAIRKGQLNGSIIHYAWKDISLLPSYITASDICFSPIVKNAQHDSGIANKVFQYLLFESPIIVSNCTPQKHLVENVACGLVFESENVEDLQDNIEYLLDHPEEAKKMGIRGKEIVQNKYNLKIMRKNLIRMYEKLNAN